jgi:hypothetical protein
MYGVVVNKAADAWWLDHYRQEARLTPYLSYP